MRNDADPHMSSLDKGVYDNLTGFGRFLRRTSIDETLQLFNIFVGQMAFIGPRPLIDVNERDAITIQLRKKNGWSQEELAEKLDVSRQSVSKWEAR